MKKIRTHEIKNWNFLCTDNSLTCFEKAHKYYIPNNLFKEGKTLHNYNLSKIDGKVKLFMERKKALTGIKNGYQNRKSNDKRKDLKGNNMDENDEFSDNKSDVLSVI